MQQSAWSILLAVRGLQQITVYPLCHQGPLEEIQDHVRIDMPLTLCGNRLSFKLLQRCRNQVLYSLAQVINTVCH